MKEIRKFARATKAIAICAPLFSSPAMAQLTPEPTAEAAVEPAAGSAFPEIVVTAQKRSQNIQDVPISISAFGAEALQERGVNDVSQLSAIAPNVTLDASVPFSAASSVLAASIRGIGSNDFAFNIDPGVGVYIDGVYLARSVGANQDLLDIERIEVLKGPQGTLFGRNTIGGAVSVVTREPGREFKGVADFTVGRFNLLHGRASIDVPLSDSLFSSVTFGIKSRDGYGRRIPFPDARAANTPSFRAFPQTGYEAPLREGDEDSRTVRVKLRYDDGGPFRMTLSGDYQKSSGSAPYTLLQTTENAPGVNFANFYNICIASDEAALTGISAATGFNFNNLCGSYGTQLPSNRRGLITPVLQVFGLSGVNADADPNNDRLPYDSRFITGMPDVSYATGNNFSDLENWGLAATAEFDVSEDATLKSITAYREGHWLSGLDVDGSPINMFHVSFDQDQWQFSQELQLTGNTLDGRLNYVLGAYYFKEKGTLLDLVLFGEGMNMIDGPNWLETQNYAGFGQIDFRPIDLIGITLGARYTHEDKEFEGGQQELNGLFYKLAGCSTVDGIISPDMVLPNGQTCRVALNYPTDANPLRVYPEGINKRKFNNFSPKIGIQLYPNDDAMIYASWSKGYKTGGWTTRYTTPQTLASSYDPEKATTYEIGFKTTWLDRHLLINGAAFTTKYTDIQLNYQVGSSPTIANVGDARIKGFELEVVGRPLTGLSINGSVGYLDAYYTALDPAVAATSGPCPSSEHLAQLAA